MRELRLTPLAFQRICQHKAGLITKHVALRKLSRQITLLQETKIFHSLRIWAEIDLARLKLHVNELELDRQMKEDQIKNFLELVRSQILASTL